MTHEMKLKEIYFNKIKSGEKIYEIRLNDEKRRLINVGDDLIFKKEPELKETFTAKVKDLIYFNSFDEMVNNLSLEKIGFENMTKQSVKDVYYQFYSKSDEIKFGVLAIKVQLINEK